MSKTKRVRIAVAVDTDGICDCSCKHQDIDQAMSDDARRTLHYNNDHVRSPENIVSIVFVEAEIPIPEKIDAVTVKGSTLDVNKLCTDCGALLSPDSD